MKRRDAVKLHNEDEVIVKKTGQVLRVIESCWHLLDKHGNPRVINLLLNDGKWYNHKDVKSMALRFGRKDNK